MIEPLELGLELHLHERPHSTEENMEALESLCQLCSVDCF
jgi:hypothetical protein